MLSKILLFLLTHIILFAIDLDIFCLSEFFVSFLTLPRLEQLCQSVSQPNNTADAKRSVVAEKENSSRRADSPHLLSSQTQHWRLRKDRVHCFCFVGENKILNQIIKFLV